MTLLDRTRLHSTPPGPGSTDPGGAGLRAATAAGYGALGALAGTLALVVPALLAWLTDPKGTTSWTDALSSAPTFWVLAHRGSVAVPGDAVTVTLPLLALTLGALWLARIAARHALAHTESDADRTWWLTPAAFVGGYALTGAVLALLAWIGPSRPSPVTVLPGAVVVAAVAMVWATLRDSDEPAARPVLLALQERLPATLSRALRPALEGFAVLMAVGLLLVMLLLVTGWSGVSQVHGELGAPTTGSVLLVLGQLAAVPNAAAWGAVWVSGAAVQIGPVTLGHASVTPGILPMVPALGALPQAGAAPAWAPFVPVLVLAAGGLVGWRSAARTTRLAAFSTKLVLAAVAGALAAVLVLVTAFVGSLGLSGGSLSYVGPSPLAVPLLIVEMSLSAVVAAAAVHYWRTR